MSERTQAKATIKRASKAAQEAMNTLDADTLAALTLLYKDSVSSLHQAIDSYTDGSGLVKLEVLQGLLITSQATLARLEAQKAALLNDGLVKAAQLGVKPFITEQAVLNADLGAIANKAVLFTKTFIAEDGLQLSDRIWRIDNHAKQIVANAINQAVIQGHSASRAAQELLSGGYPVGKDLQSKMTANAAGPMKQSIADQLMTGEGNPYANALRVARTELNRAHGEAYQAGAFSHPDVAATKFLLSPNHPRFDICDLHAHANLYGLGPGCYPKGKNPWPAHPNTLSYTQAVFVEEVSAEDKANQQTRLDWLKAQPQAVQESVLNSRKKRIAMEKGLLPENAIATPWYILKARLQKQGHDIESW